MSIENDPAAPVGDSTEIRAGLSRRTIMKGAAWTVPALMVATSAPAYAISCGPTAKFTSAGLGRILSGSLLGLNLDSVAQVQGAYAANGLTPYAKQASPLTISALSAITLPLDPVAGALSSILGWVTPADTAVLNQFGEAKDSGESTGAAGYVADDGAIRTDTPAGGMPGFASIDLQRILSNSAVTSLPVVGPAVTALVGATTGTSALHLNVGAIAGRAFRKANCIPMDAGQLTREYVIAGLRLALTPADASLVGSVITALTGITVSANIDTTQLLTALLGPLGALLSATTVSATGAVTISTASLGNAIPADPNSPLRLDLGNNEVTIDLASAAGLAYSTPAGYTYPMINAVPPNSKLFSDTPLSGATNATNGLIDGLITGLLSILSSLATVDINLTAKDPIFGSTLATLHVYGPLTNLAVDGTGLLGGLLSGLVTAVKSNVAALVNPIVTSLTNGALKTALNTALAPVHALLGVVFAVIGPILKLRLNAQNTPLANTTPATGAGYSPEPARWVPPLVPAGQYRVAPLHLSIAEALDVLDLFLAAGGVGSNLPR